MSKVPDYYEVLEVHPKAEHRRIRKAYLDLMQQYHPDHGGDQDRARLIIAAWEILGDPSRRAAYDRERAAGGRIHQKPRDRPQPSVPSGFARVEGEVRFVRFERQPRSDFVKTHLVVAPDAFGRVDLQGLAAFVEGDGLAGRVTLGRGDRIALSGVWAEDGSCRPERIENLTTGHVYDLVLRFPPVPLGYVEFFGRVRMAYIRGEYGTDRKYLKLVVTSPKYGTLDFDFSCLVGGFLPENRIEVEKGDLITFVFDNNYGDVSPRRLLNHTQSLSYDLNSKWAVGFSILEALGHIGRAFR